MLKFFLPLLFLFASGKALVFEFWIAKVDEQADFDSSGVQIIDYLRLVFSGDSFDSFQFDDYLLSYVAGPHKNHQRIHL